MEGKCEKDLGFTSLEEKKLFDECSPNQQFIKLDYSSMTIPELSSFLLKIFRDIFGADFFKTQREFLEKLSVSIAYAILKRKCPAIDFSLLKKYLNDCINKKFAEIEARIEECCFIPAPEPVEPEEQVCYIVLSGNYEEPVSLESSCKNHWQIIELVDVCCEGDNKWHNFKEFKEFKNTQSTFFLVREETGKCC